MATRYLVIAVAVLLCAVALLYMVDYEVAYTSDNDYFVPSKVGTLARKRVKQRNK